MAMDHETNHSDVSESDNGQDSTTGGAGAINLTRPASAPTTESPTNSRIPTKTSSSISIMANSARINGDNVDSSDQQVSTHYL